MARTEPVRFQTRRSDERKTSEKVAQDLIITGHQPKRSTISSQTQQTVEQNPLGKLLENFQQICHKVYPRRPAADWVKPIEKVAQEMRKELL